MNPYESPTHCELAPSSIDWNIVGLLLAVASWPILYPIAAAMMLFDQLNEPKDWGRFFSGLFWCGVLAIDVAFIWSIFIYFILRFCK